MHVTRRYKNSLLNVFLHIKVIKSNTLRIEACKGWSDGFLYASGSFVVFNGGRNLHCAQPERQDTLLRDLPKLLTESAAGYLQQSPT